MYLTFYCHFLILKGFTKEMVFHNLIKNKYTKYKFILFNNFFKHNTITLTHFSPFPNLEYIPDIS